MPTSSRNGGCTFPENPDQSCASVLPMWSAAVDPCVLTVRAIEPVGMEARLFDGFSADVRMIRGLLGEHLLIDRGGELVRLDVIEGTTAAGPVVLNFELADDDHLEALIAVIGTFRGAVMSAPRHGRLARRLFGLQAVDARNAGASLKETADILFGPGDWPGDGEHRKSHVRRLLDAGFRMIRAGPREILKSN